MSLMKHFQKAVAGFTTAALLLSPFGSSFVMAVEDEYSVSVTPDSITAEAGEEFELTATFYKNGEEFDPESEGMHFYWWSETMQTTGSSPNSYTNTFTYNAPGTYEWDLKVELADSDWICVARAYPVVTITESQEPTEPDEPSVEELTDGLTVSIDSESVHVGDTVNITADYVVGGEEVTVLPDGYELWFWADIWSDGHDDGSTDITVGANSGSVLSDTVTFNSEGTYYIAAEVKSGGSRVDIAFITVEVTEESEELEEGLNVSIDSYEVHTDDTVTITARYVVDGEELTDLPDGYELWFWADIWSDGHDDGSTDITVETDSGSTLVDRITFNSEGMYYIAAELKNGSERVAIEFLTINVTDAVEPVEGRINFDGVPTLPDDFFMGVDVSSVVSELNAGVVYYDYEGNALNTVNSFIGFLASQGVNCVRVRVWNNPYDSEGNGFGGGNNDVQTAKIIADACEAAGITMLVDFHLSDFWCDPSKQYAPVAWSSLTASQKADAIAAFITDSLNTIDPNGNTVAMVQVGNETNGAICGVSNSSDMCMLFDAGCDAVHDWNSSVRAVIHFTNPERGTLANWASTLSSADVSADVLATSYYPYWHGSLANLEAQLSSARTYGFDVMVAETSYAYTIEDSDGHDNTVRTGINDSGDNLLQPFTVQGQARAVRDVVNSVNRAGGIGMFYWEPAWITVGSTIGLTGSDYDAQVAANRALWETCGCGWASSFAGTYDPNDAGRWYGGSAVDNEALFYADGTATAAWDVYRNIRTGEYSNDVTPETVESFEASVEIGGEYELPATAVVTYSDGSKASVEVAWNEEQAAAFDTGVSGTYVVSGVAGGLNTTYTLTVLENNLLPEDIAGFETTDYASAYAVEGDGINVHYNGDARTGSYAAHWWSSAAVVGSIALSEAIELSEAGTYTFTGYVQGDADKGSNVTFAVIDAGSGEVIARGDAVTTAGWNEWLSPSVSFDIDAEASVILVVELDYAAGGWGTVDDLCLFLEAAAEPGTEPDVDPVVDPIVDPVVEPVVPAEDNEEPVSESSSSAAAAAVTTVSLVAPAQLTLAAFIENLYSESLGRQADETGMNYWLTEYESGNLTVNGLVEGFFLSEEYLTSDKTDEEFLTDLYHALLRREPDEKGMEHWLDCLASGMEREEVIDGFVDSEEFAAIAASYGLSLE